MATSVDQLIVEIRAETAGLRKGLDRVNKQLDVTNKRAKASVLSFSNLGRVFAVLGLAKLGSGIINTARTFEDLEATLVAVTQSSANAKTALGVIEDFTKTTPFQLENVTEAFTRFYQAGITPSKENLTAFGNVAAANNKDITQLAQAVFNATTGEMEMLKQFGIKAKQSGDEITMIFEGQETTMKNTSENISEFLLNIGRTRFEGAIEARLQTLSGALSNAKDQAGLVAKEIGEAGLTSALVEVTAAFSEIMTDDSAGGLAKVLGELAGIAADVLVIALKALAFNLQIIVTSFNAVLTAVDFLIIGFLEFAKSFQRPLNSILRQFSKFVNGFIEIYNQLPMWLRGEPMEKVSFEIDTEKIDANIEHIRTRIATRLNDPSFFGGRLGDGVTGVQTSDGSEGGSIVPPAATKEAKEASNAVVDLKESMKELQPVITETVNGFSTDFVDSLMSGESAMDSFKNLFKDMVANIIASAMQMMVIKPIMDAIFAGLGFPTGAAGGGTLQANRPMLVGERGPEIFVPNTGGTLLNNMNSKNAMSGGGVTVVQNNNFALGVGATARAEVQKMLPQIAETSKMAVLEASARGGAFRKTLMGGA